jgi:hypothetical protein
MPDKVIQHSQLNGYRRGCQITEAKRAMREDKKRARL